MKYEDPEVIRDLIRVRDEACFSCPFSCGKRSRIKDPEYPLTAKGPEHETMALLGANCGLGDMEDICRANYLCNELGMDTITAGAMISCAMELFEEGHLPESRPRLPPGVRQHKHVHTAQTNSPQGGHRRSHGRRRHSLCDEIRASRSYLWAIKGMGIPAWHPPGIRCPGVAVRHLQYGRQPHEVDHALL